MTSKTFNKILFSSLLLSAVLVFTHLKKVQKIEFSETGRNELIFNQAQFKLRCYLTLSEPAKINANFSFSELKDTIKIKSLKAQVNHQSAKSIEPYAGSQFENFMSYQNFQAIPDSLKTLTPPLKPYFAFDHSFIFGDTKKDHEFSLKIVVMEQGIETIIEKNLKFNVVSKIRLQPLDKHSDISFLLIYPALIFSSLLLILRLIFFFWSRNKNSTLHLD